MCGIFGIFLFENESSLAIENLLINGLKRLEYRGYDSAGISVMAEENILTVRMKGKIDNLQNEVNKFNFNEEKSLNILGIGHTRWATHGKATSANAHPHSTEDVAIVHNGIIENFQEIRSNLQKQGRNFSSETDSEVIPHLICSLIKEQNLSPFEATKIALKNLEGAFAIAAIFRNHHNLMIATRKGSPLAVGKSNKGYFVGSDAYALAEVATHICYLEEGDICVISGKNIKIYDEFGEKVERIFSPSSHSGALIGKGNFRHFMLKEIFEQPIILGELINHYFDQNSLKIKMDEIDISCFTSINIIGCGTSYFAGMIAKYWLETIARIPCQIDIASEFRYRNPIIAKNSLNIFISQSGETADSLAAMKFIESDSNNPAIMAIVNVAESSMVRESKFFLPILAGPEIGVASTKAFTAQLVTLAFLTLKFAQKNQSISKAEFNRLISQILELPGRISSILSRETEIKAIAKTLADSKTILYTGRGVSYAAALEGALKLKELSYIHAEAIAAGEMKHGPIALIDENVPIIAIAPRDELFDKIASNLREIAARGGKIILISDAKAARELEDLVWQSFVIPDFNEIFSPILYSIPLQLMAYHVALFKGTDVDQPRNLAKSVTVE